ncbi:MAG: outer membrane beta-barrel protein [Ginsengibacter sp.]
MKTLLTVLLTIIFSPIFAQKITGEVKDDAGNPIVAATAILRKASDSSVVKIGITSGSGSYEFINIKPGNYFVKITNVGYGNVRSADFIYKAEELKLPLLTLSKNVAGLKAVEVIAQKPPIEVKADKIIFNVESNITATGLDGMELLRQSPGVLVDQDDNITIAGKTGVQIYIDGKPSPLGGKDLSNYLRSLRSTSIETIEIINNPSSKYEAAGTGGIINIRLKKNKNVGTNGSVNYDFQQAIWAKHNAGFSLNHRNAKMNIYSNYNFTKAINEFDLDVYRKFADTIFDSYSKTYTHTTAHNMKAGVDFFLNKNSTVGIMMNGNFSKDSSISNNDNSISSAITNKTDRILVSDNITNSSRNTISINANYRYTDKSGHDLNMDADYGNFKLRSNQYQPNIFYDSTRQNVLSTQNYTMITPSDINIYTFKVDYEQNVLKGRLGFGGKTAFVNSNNIFNFYNLDNNFKLEYDSVLSNHFIYKENINALYVNYNRSFKNFQWQLGVRAEQTVTTGSSSGFVKNGTNGFSDYHAEFKRHLFDLFPSSAITFTKNPKLQWTISYGRRINRPSYQDLNPFEKRGSLYGGFKGNPNLRPEYANTFSIINVFKSKLVSNFSYNHIKDVIVSIVDTLNGNKSFYAPKNLATQNTFSLSENYSYNKKWYSLSGSATGYYTHNTANFGPGRVINIKVYAVRASIQNNFTLGKGWSTSLSGWYNSPALFRGTIRTNALYALNGGIQKLLLKQKATIRMNVNDIFDNVHFTGTSDFAGQYIFVSGSFEAQRLVASFSYRFGSNQVKSSRQRKTGLDEESKRTNDSGQ